MKNYLRKLVTISLFISFLALSITIGSLTVTAATADPIVAEVGSEKITLSQFQAELKKLPPNLQQMASDKKMQKEFLEQLATSKLLYQEGIKQGLSKDPVIMAQIDEISHKIILAALLQREIEARIKAPTPEDVNQYYQTHADEFKQPKQVRARHILVKDEKEAKAIEAELKKGADFATVAKDKSSCPSSAKGGDLGFFTRDRMVKEFSDTAFALKVGEVSAPVKTQFGYHIIEVVEIKEAGAKPLDEVRTEIENKLTQENKSRVFKEYIDSLKKKTKVTLYPDVIEK
ncbi:MAG: peptidyl-prolyl cis-trans isomerase [Pseudomonadota bacterium]|nr:peptidyl-prolyl cis-trans isomerase [Pseudomonadota bacterium]